MRTLPELRNGISKQRFMSNVWSFGERSPCSRERFFVETRKPDDGDAETSSRRDDDGFGGKDPRDGWSLS